MCLNNRGHKTGDGIALTVILCRGDRAEWLTWTSAELLEFPTGCLQASTAAANAAVSLAVCDATNQNQRWVVTH